MTLAPLWPLSNKAHPCWHTWHTHARVEGKSVRMTAAMPKSETETIDVATGVRLSELTGWCSSVVDLMSEHPTTTAASPALTQRTCLAGHLFLVWSIAVTSGTCCTATIVRRQIG